MVYALQAAAAEKDAEAAYTDLRWIDACAALHDAEELYTTCMRVFLDGAYLLPNLNSGPCIA